MPNWKKVITSGSDASLNSLSINGNTVLTTENYDTRVCHLKTNIDAAIAQGSGTAFDVNFNLEEHNDSSLFSHSSGVITVLSDGWYRIYANMVYDNASANARNTIRAYVSINGSEITSTATYDYDRGTSYGRFSNNKIETILYLTSSDTIAISNYAYNEDGVVTIESAECEFIVNSVAVQTSATNADTVDGLHGTQFVRSDIDASLTGSFTGSFTGDGTNLTGLFSVTNETDNYVITSTGAGGGNGEANLTFDGSELGLAGDLVMAGGSIGVGVTPNATAGRIDASNDIVAYSSSDKRWKTNIKLIESPLEKLQKLSGVEFDWIEDTELHGNSGNDVGVIAQEVELVLPQAVQTRDTGMKAVRYEKLIPLLIETIKEQQKQIDELKNKIG